MRRASQRSVSGRAREIPALLFALSWVLGVVVGPAIHLARHASLEPHDHERASAHCHGDVCHEDERAESEGSPAPDHGEGSLEHGGLAVLAPPPVIAEVLGAPIAELLAPHEVESAPASARTERARARAPPRLVAA